MIMSVTEAGHPHCHCLLYPGPNLKLEAVRLCVCACDSAELTLPSVTEFVSCLLTGRERHHGVQAFGDTAGRVGAAQGLTLG